MTIAPDIRKADWTIFAAFLSGAVTIILLLTSTRAVLRYELQNIDHRFEINAFLRDLTGTAQQPAVRTVIFNRLPEDEAPPEAVAAMPWLAQISKYPVRRSTMSQWIHFLRQAGAKAIIIDEDFASSSPDDVQLATELVNSRLGNDGLPSTLVFFVRNVVRGSFDKLNVIQRVSEAASISTAIHTASSGRFSADDFTGTSIMLPDEDQVIRRILLRMPDPTGTDIESVIVVASNKLNLEPGHKFERPILDINFTAPPNSPLFPVRSLTYLVDPARRAELIHRDPAREDVAPAGAVVFIGDGIADVFNTPMTHTGLMQMSGTEILAQALNTVAARSAIQRTDDNFDKWNSLACSIAIVTPASLLWLTWSTAMRKSFARKKRTRLQSAVRIGLDTAFVIFLLVLNAALAQLVFMLHNLLIPVLIPSLAIICGALTATLADRNREQRLLHESQLALSEYNLKQEFVRRINHDLNAPVTVLNWALADMEQSESSPELKENIQVLLRTSARLGMLLDEMSRHYGQQETAKQHVSSLNEAIENSVGMLHALVKARDGAIVVDLPAEPVYVTSNMPDLLRVFDNLIRNAVKHNPKGTSIKVALMSGENTAIATVSDNGSGMTPETAKRILGSDPPPNGFHGNGHGMGIGIVKGLVRSMNGELRLETEEGKGTTFEIRIPTIIPECPEGASTQHEESPVD